MMSLASLIQKYVSRISSLCSVSFVMLLSIAIIINLVFMLFSTGAAMQQWQRHRQSGQWQCHCQSAFNRPRTRALTSRRSVGAAKVPAMQNLSPCIAVSVRRAYCFWVVSIGISIHRFHDHSWIYICKVPAECFLCWQGIIVETIFWRWLDAILLISPNLHQHCSSFCWAFRLIIHVHIGMSCPSWPSWQWHRTGSSWSPVRTLQSGGLWAVNVTSCKMNTWLACQDNTECHHWTCNGQ